jgi:lysophospholipase L1-like esterase
MFLKGSAVLVGGVLSHHVFSSPLLRGAITTRATPRPLQMLVLGDSVMWGQGLKDEHKFSYLVRDWLCQKRSRLGSCQGQSNQNVQLHVEAHSGATIFKDQDKDDSFPTYPGEVNYSNPTIPAQVGLAVDYYQRQSIPLQNVDLILVNGGINDLGAGRLIIPKLFARSIEHEADDFCRVKMLRLLKDLARTFPNARIVVPGYFPLVSEMTPWQAVIDVLKMAFPQHEEKVEKLRKADEAGQAAQTLGISSSLPHPVRAFLAKVSQNWVSASNEAMSRAITELNLARPLISPAPQANNGNGTTSSSTPPATTTPQNAVAPQGAVPAIAKARAFFVQVPFGPENAYGTPKTYLWRLVHNEEKLSCTGSGFDQNVKSEDEIFRERACMCKEARKENDLICLRAGFMHPNKEGALAYKDAIVQALEKILPFTGWV